MSSIQRIMAGVIALLLAVPLPLLAQQNQAAATPFKAEELDQLVAPIALYPDPLLAQVLMASTHPLDVVQAARFAKANASLQGGQRDQALQKEVWDDSVKSLVAFPGVLTMMDAKLDWTQKLGDAFLAQQADVMNAVQRLRAKAEAAGNLKSPSQQTVTTEPAAAPAPAAQYDRAHRLEGGGGKVVLYVGADDFPFPIPLVPDGAFWRFDTAAGTDEILNRRIGKNELEAIQACLAYVDAQREYHSVARNSDGVREYPQRLASVPGKRDGLFWETKPGESPSPLGPLLARARAQGYGKARAGKQAPYHGYYYRVLTAQGPAAPGGAYVYLARGRMIGGFALVAFPAQYGASGVMTFIVNHDGVVYQKDLGPNRTALAEAIKQFNPDAGWTKADPV